MITNNKINEFYFHLNEFYKNFDAILKNRLNLQLIVKDRKNYLTTT